MDIDSLKLLSDEELFSCLSSNDSKQAFELIYKKHYPSLLRYSYSKVGDFEQAEDIVQEVLMQLWSRRFELSFHTSVNNYLRRAVKYKIIDLISKMKHRKTYLDSLEYVEQSSVSDTDYLLRESLFREMIEQEIDKLPKRMKEVFIMSRYEYMSHQEIADKLGLSVHTVSTQIKKTLKILRNSVLQIIFFFILK